MGKGSRIFIVLLACIVFVFFLISLYLVFLHAPTEKVMGPVQKIFYYHVPSAISTFLAFFVVFIASIIYLATKSSLWDNIARSSAEIGVFFCTIVLITGPIWAKQAWGTWWTWEARLTTTLILWLIYVSYLMIRGYSENREQAARFSSILGIVGFLDVPIIYFSVKWWRGQHPIVFGPGKQEPLAPEMLHAFLFSLFTFLLFYLLLMIVRTRISSLEDRASTLKEKIL
ncbi:MAG: cytochrome c biogenesis protein CcsA [Acidobacteriota bacterium]